MKIKKIGHCCLLIEIENVTILTDPGSYSSAQDEEKGIDLILITHEHADHLHINSLINILKNNPNAKIITNSSVGEILSKENIKFEIVEDQQVNEYFNIKIEGFGKKHAIIHKSLEIGENTGYFIDNILFYPGDALTNPKKKVEILALPVAGPWLKLSEAIDYAIEINPKVCFPVHDAILKTPSFMHHLTKSILYKANIEFKGLNENEEINI